MKKSLYALLAHLFILFFVLLSTCEAKAPASVDEMLQLANEDYSSGRYEEAMRQYNAIIGQNGLSAEILYNLGNSYAENGQSGLAILQYLRALRLTPGDADIQGNLDLMRKEIGLFEEDPSFFDRVWDHFDMNQWSKAALAGLILFTVLLAAASRVSSKKGVKASAMVMLLLMTIAVFGAFRQHAVWQAHIIILPETRLLMSPFESASSLGSIKEGSLVFREKSHGKYFYIHDSKRRSGWIPAASCEPINTSSTRYLQADTGR